MTKNTINNNNNKNTGEKTTINYGFYSKLLQKPFDSLSELAAAEAAYLDKQKAKEDAAAQKKADAKKVEDAFKALNAARNEYKEKLSQLTTEYHESFEQLKKAYDLGRTDLKNALVDADNAYTIALREFTEKYKQYHLTLKDGDAETTISSYVDETAADKCPDFAKISDIIDWIFNN
jgi:uncharacterized membrane protein YkoI